MRRLFLLGLALLTACGDGQSEAEKAASDARDVAEVEAVQKRRPPLQAIVPQELGVAEFRLLPDGGKACRLLLRDRREDEPVAWIGRETAHLKLEGRIVTLAADHGSEQFAGGIYRKYSGKTHWLEMDLGEGGAGSITIRDRYDRPVFLAAGELACGMASPSREVSVPQR